MCGKCDYLLFLQRNLTFYEKIYEKSLHICIIMYNFAAVNE